MVTKAKILSFKQVAKRENKIPRSWLRAFGLLKKKNIDPVKYQRRKRAQWER